MMGKRKRGSRRLLMALLALALLPYDTLICLGAILRSGVRMLFTRRGLLLLQLPSYSNPNPAAGLPPGTQAKANPSATARTGAIHISLKKSASVRRALRFE